MRVPLNNPDNDGIFDRELTPREIAGIRKKKELANFFFSDLVDKENGVVVAPDTTGVDYFFLRYFITEAMEADFPVIMQDFMDKCRDRLSEFNEVGWYGDEQYRTIRPLDGMYNRIMRLMYNGAKIGDGYCTELKTIIKKAYLNGRKKIISPKVICTEMDISKATYDRRLPDGIVLFGMLIWIYACRRELEDIEAGVVEKPDYYDRIISRVWHSTEFSTCSTLELEPQIQ